MSHGILLMIFFGASLMGFFCSMKGGSSMCAVTVKEFFHEW